MQPDKTKKAIKQLSKGIFIFLYLLCFTVLLLLPTATSLAYEEHEHENKVICQATGMPECNCNVVSSRLSSGTADNSGEITFKDLNCHTEITDDCGTCALVNKSVTQKRYSSLSTCSLLNTDIFLDSQEMTDVGLICTTIPTPVSLKTKQCN